MSVAQDDYRRMLRESVTPALHEAGFKGSNGRYQLPSNFAWALLDFQKSVSSSADAIKFTVNLLVVGRQTWTKARETWSYYPEKPSANSLWKEAEWQVRIGQLLADGQDHWWWLRVGDDLSELGSDVLRALKSKGLPKLEQELAVIEQGTSDPT